MRQSVPIRSRISRRALGPRDDADSILFEHEFLHAKDEPSFARSTLFLLLAFILGAQLPEAIG